MEGRLVAQSSAKAPCSDVLVRRTENEPLVAQSGNAGAIDACLPTPDLALTQGADRSQDGNAP